MYMLSYITYIHIVVQEFRKSYSLTQKQLAEYLGVTPNCIIQWEINRRNPPKYLELALRGLSVEINTTDMTKRF